MATTAQSTEQLAVDTIRTLAMDAVQNTGNGHPGMPMGMAPVGYLLFSEVMRHNPTDPHWPDRDRFVLSAGHGSMLLYACLHLSGYDVTMDDIKHFRQWGSRTPGHPEVHHTPGVETTTGPLGQGFANAVGMAIAERFLREHFGAEVQDHRIYGICSDGDLMEGVSAEAASLAGHLGLGHLIFLYDHNHISIDGHTSLTFDTEDVNERFDAYGWHTQDVDDVTDLDALRAAIAAAQQETGRPSLIRVRSKIGYPAPNKQDTPGAHGAALGEDEVRATKEVMGWDPDQHFVVPDGVYDLFSAVEDGKRHQAAWEERYQSWRAADGERATRWDLAWAGKPLPGLDAALPQFDPADKPSLATRSAGGTTLQTIARFLPTMVGGSADLNESVKTGIAADGPYSREQATRNVYWGIREHAMGAAVNGLALHGGIVKPYGGTFLQFADYMRPALRLSALMHLPVVWVYTHDSVALGEDGPTHQPVEHLAALRAIPGLTLIRPSDANETAEAWRVAVEDVDGPVVLVLTRQNVPTLERPPYAPAKGIDKGAYVLADADDAVATIVGTGSEVSVALGARDLLAAEGVAARVVAMPSWELFEAQDQAYRDEVLPPGQPKVAVEAGIAMGWERWVDATVSIERFGASAAGEKILEEYGITAAAVAERVRSLLT
ncbi:transketolase [Conexibacter woesei]|uniref:Transketolase n=1 Tax=Conexibacter woesei (strain DSM 14684 / CCUG 47730 / CIP 108061 / JCM 11494 / NBRC 100937 / ID131577) TaxID=469383 RepID=D3F4W1_CONWI|nr:transketolase [Conexibacter woesei]ADB48539.1 transketolase [Conexibacter woesei DSM 14684]